MQPSNLEDNLSDPLKPATATPLNPRRRGIIIGASEGLGAELARQLAREGYTLALLARRGELLDSLCDAINRTSNEKRAFAYPHNVDRKSTRLNSSHLVISYAVFCLKKKNK